MCVASYAHAAATGTEASATAAATAAQYGLNTAMLSCPLTWIVVGIMALIIVLVALCNHFSGAGHIAQSTFGAICGGINVVIQYFKNWGLSVADIFIGIWNAGEHVQPMLRLLFTMRSVMCRHSGITCCLQHLR